MASDPAVEASAAEGAGSCGRSAAAAFTATAAAPSCAAALAATAAAPSCAAALAAFAAFTALAALAERTDGVGQHCGAGPVADQLRAAALGLEVPDERVVARRGGAPSQGAHQHVPAGVLGAAASGKRQHLGAAASVLHLRLDPGQPRRVRVQLGPRDQDAQQVQRKKLHERGRLDPLGQLDAGRAHLFAQALPGRQCRPEHRGILRSDRVREVLGLREAVLRRRAGPLGAEVAPQQQPMLVAAPCTPEQAVADGLHDGAVQGEVHLHEIHHAQVAHLGGRAGLELWRGLGLRPDQQAANILPPLAQMPQGPLTPDLERLWGHTCLQRLGVPAARVNAELAGLAAARGPRSRRRLLLRHLGRCLRPRVGLEAGASARHARRWPGACCPMPRVLARPGVLPRRCGRRAARSRSRSRSPKSRSRRDAQASSAGDLRGSAGTFAEGPLLCQRQRLLRAGVQDLELGL